MNEIAMNELTLQMKKAECEYHKKQAIETLKDLRKIIDTLIERDEIREDVLISYLATYQQTVTRYKIAEAIYNTLKSTNE